MGCDVVVGNHTRRHPTLPNEWLGLAPAIVELDERLRARAASAAEMMTSLSPELKELAKDFTKSKYGEAFLAAYLKTPPGAWGETRQAWNQLVEHGPRGVDKFTEEDLLRVALALDLVSKDDGTVHHERRLT